MFIDRADAGRRLAEHVRHLRDERPLVVGLPRGGIPVAHELARTLEAPLEALVVEKIRAPQHPGITLGAMGPDAQTYFDPDTMSVYGGDKKGVDHQLDATRKALTKRMDRLGVKGTPWVGGRSVILVDDGIASGSAVHAAVTILRKGNPSRIILATPVIDRASVDRMENLVDELVYLQAPDPLEFIGKWYEQYPRLDDETVRRILESPRSKALPPELAGNISAKKEQETLAKVLDIPIDDILLRARVTVPDDPQGVVLFAHGTDATWEDKHTRHLERTLNENRLATILVDLLTSHEHAMESPGMEQVHEHFELLADRLSELAHWAQRDPSFGKLPLATMGTDSGAITAILCAARHTDRFHAVVSLQGRLDLVGQDLGLVRAPTLLLVGDADKTLVHLNEDAQGALECENRLHLVQTHEDLLGEPRALKEAGEEAADWIIDHLETPAQYPAHWTR